MAEEKKTVAKKAPAKKAAPKAKKEVAPKAEEPKKAKKAKAEPEVPAKPPVTSARATAYDVRVTPRKARLVIDLIRGKNVNEALGILANVNKAASPIVAKVVKSAAANAENNFDMNPDNLYVAEVYANQGPTMKRWRAGSQGRASIILKRSSHVGVTLKEKE